MYTALLSYVKSAIVSHGIAITNLCLQRFFVILLIEFMRWVLYSTCLSDDETNMRVPHTMDGSVNDLSKKKKRDSVNFWVPFYFVM